MKRRRRIHAALYVVAPRAGAWIETKLGALRSGQILSPPARGRGLKQACDNRNPRKGTSPPARGRGLKQCA